MLNYETVGSELAKTFNNARSTEDIVINEDHAMLMEVTAIYNGIVSATKVWDISQSKKSFGAILKYHGRAGTPSDSSIKIGDIVIFWRVGEFSGTGNNGYELHTEDPTKCSWICFVEPYLCYVKDLGMETHTGVEVEYIADSWVEKIGGETLVMKTIDPVTNFYGETPPFKADRIYLAIKDGGYYLIDLQGFGEEEEVITRTTSGLTFSLSLDSAGHVLDFEVS